MPNKLVMKIAFDLMGVLFEPSRIIYNGFYPKLREELSYEEIKNAYKKAVIGDSKELNLMIKIERQKKILLEVVKPTIDFTILKNLDKDIYVVSNLPYLWGLWLIDKYLKNHISGAFISGFMGKKKPQKEMFEDVSRVIGRNVIFFDDKEENLKTAKEIGWKVKKVERSEQLKKELQKITKHF